MDAAYNQAINAYAQQAKMMKERPLEALDSEESHRSGGFAAMLQQAVNSAVGTQHAAEAVQMQNLGGQADLSELVTAITNAELTLDTIVAVRDKVISAYQSIIAMPI